jgi:GNAT superfamily N-acetyltransferase
MVTFAVEQLHPDLIPFQLFQDHYAEIAAPKNSFVKPAPDWSRYLEAQEKGEFIAIIARDQGKVVGYMSIFLQPHQHYIATVMAVDDMHYLMPSYRGRGAGKQMIEFAEQAAVERGATVFSMRCKAAQDHGHIFKSLGYELSDLVYLKELTPCR